MRSEFGFLKDLKNHFNLQRIGDDSAVFPKDNKHDYLITSDLLVEDIDFRLSWTTPKFLAYKALAVSVSDIAAMAGRPCFSLLSIGIPENLWKSGFLDKFYESYQSKATDYGVELIGGDLSKTSDKLSIDSTVIGTVPKGKAILRSGAKPGDGIYVTGNLGGAAGGLRLLESGIIYAEAKPWQKALVEKQLRPVPANGELLREMATSMIDISDGLSSDLKHLCDAGRVGAIVYGNKIPSPKELRQIAENDDEILRFALDGGEDFELLFTANPDAILKSSGFICHHIGDITNDHDTFDLVINGVPTRIDPGGYEHFRSSV